jgi:sugar phosphate isomerase/epimerase
MDRQFAFSTLGCPGASIDEICRIARDSGWNALELRVSDDESIRTGLDGNAREAARSALRSAGLRIFCLASYVRVGKPDITDQDCADDLLRHLDLACDLGAEAVRVFAAAGESTDAADARMSRRMSAVAERFASAGVLLLLETHDSHRAAAAVARVLERVDHPAVGAVWDILHTWLAGETPAESGRKLAPWLRHVQMKDVASAEDLTPVGLGVGVLPLVDLLAVLDSLGYQGCLSLEWERRWHPRADPLPVALVQAGAWLASHTALS